MERRAGGCAPGAAFLKLENTPPPPPPQPPFPSRPLSPPRPRDVSRASAPPPASGQREAGTGGHRRAPAARPSTGHGARPAPAPPPPPPPAGSPQPAGAGCPPAGERAARRGRKVKQGEEEIPLRLLLSPPISGMPRPGPRRGRDTPAEAGASRTGAAERARAAPAPSPAPLTPRSRSVLPLSPQLAGGNQSFGMGHAGHWGGFEHISGV
ncbi:basic proline-rich protein-like [Motacilla alba alba]|uniref:basic proline-rich protein-like n=1 Tax=Motacilla alba alba TaxID=1094192 RepID=UPI0018D530BE|nr:basic proline-rich protein-like [Motacilla alba alba]